MNEARATEILKGICGYAEPGFLLCDSPFLSWPNGRGRSAPGRYGEACLDGNFSADQLEAIAWWMRHKAPSPA